jgi:putative transcriptional regulator
VHGGNCFWLSKAALTVFFAASLLAAVQGLHTPGRFRQAADKLAPGTFLLAPHKAADPSFAQTVILLIRTDESGALGLVINKPTTVSVSTAFPDLRAARNMTAHCYAGGPVQPEAAMALYHSSQKEQDAIAVIPDVYLVSHLTALTRILNGKPTGKNLRVYLGYTGWGPGQLEHEMDLEVWRILPAGADEIFSADPAGVWPRLIQQTELRYALLRQSFHF